MAKKAKLDLSGEGLKKLAIHHCEKAVFGICAVVLLLLAYWGYQKPVFDDQKDNPNSLITSAQQSEQRINATEWENPNNEEMSFAKYRVADEDIAEEVEKINSMMADASKYPAYPTGEISLSVKPKRNNPEILAATDVQAQFAYQLIALNPGVGGSTKINEAIFAPKPKKEEPRRRKGKSSGGSTGSDSSSMSGMMEPPSGGSGESSPGAGGMGAPSSGPGGSGGNRGPIGPMKPDYPVHEVPPTMLAELEGVPLNGILPGKQEGNAFLYPSVMWRQVVCVTAQVPYKKQLEAYNEALKGTRKYDPATDIPKYLGLVISRRVNGGQWEDVTDEIKAFSERAQTVYYPNLVADEQLDPFINAPVPAFLLRDFDSFVLHPQSKRRDFLNLGGKAQAGELEQSSSTGSSFTSFEDFGGSEDSAGPADDKGKQQDGKTDSKGPAKLAAPEFKQVRFFDLLASKNINPGDKLEYRVSVVLSNPNLPLSFLMKAKKTVGSGNMGPGMSPGMGGSAGGDLFDSDAGPSAGGSSSGGASSRGGAPGGSSSAPGAPSGPGGGYMGGAGKSRVKKTAELTIEMLGNPNISDADLEGSIRAEILKFKDMQPPKLTDKGLIRKYGLISPESEVSNVVEFTTPDEGFVAGSAPPLPIRNAGNVEFYDSDPAGELVYLARDKSLQMEVPGKATVYAGSPVVFDAKAEVFNPLDWTIRWVGPPAVDEDGKDLPDERGKYRFDSAAIVLDVHPSETLENISDVKEEFQTPAEILVFDGKGFTLRNELDDLKAFRHATFASEQPLEAAESAETGIDGFSDLFDGEDPVGSGSGN